MPVFEFVETIGAGNTKWGSITVPLTTCLTGLDWSVSQIKTKTVSCHTANSKPVKQVVNGTVILPPLVFPAYTVLTFNFISFLEISSSRSVFRQTSSSGPTGPSPLKPSRKGLEVPPGNPN